MTVWYWQKFDYLKKYNFIKLSFLQLPKESKMHCLSAM